MPRDGHLRGECVPVDLERVGRLAVVRYPAKQAPGHLKRGEREGFFLAEPAGRELPLVDPEGVCPWEDVHPNREPPEGVGH